MNHILDIEHRFILAGRDYHMRVVSDDPRPQPHLVRDDFDVSIITCPKADLDNFDCNAPHKASLDVVEGVVQLMPAKLSSEELDAFHEAVLDWVMRHRGAAALARLEHE